MHVRLPSPTTPCLQRPQPGQAAPLFTPKAFGSPPVITAHATLGDWTCLLGCLPSRLQAPGRLCGPARPAPERVWGSDAHAHLLSACVLQHTGAGASAPRSSDGSTPRSAAARQRGRPRGPGGSPPPGSRSPAPPVPARGRRPRQPSQRGRGVRRPGSLPGPQVPPRDSRARPPAGASDAPSGTRTPTARRAVARTTAHAA